MPHLLILLTLRLFQYHLSHLARLDVPLLLYEEERFSYAPVFPYRLDEGLEELSIGHQPLEEVINVVGEVIAGALRLLKAPLAERKLSMHVNGTSDDRVTVIGKAVEAKLLRPAGREFKGVHRELIAVIADIVAIGNVGVPQRTVAEQGGGLVAGKLVHPPPLGSERGLLDGHVPDSGYLGIGNFVARLVIEAARTCGSECLSVLGGGHLAF